MPRGTTRPEDIFRVTFIPTQAQQVSFFYLPKALGGRREVAPTTGTTGIIAAFDPASLGVIGNYRPTDAGNLVDRSGGGLTYAANKNSGGDEASTRFVLAR